MRTTQYKFHLRYFWRCWSLSLPKSPEFPPKDGSSGMWISLEAVEKKFMIYLYPKSGSCTLFYFRKGRLPHHFLKNSKHSNKSSNRHSYSCLNLVQKLENSHFLHSSSKYNAHSSTKYRRNVMTPRSGIIFWFVMTEIKDLWVWLS